MSGKLLVGTLLILVLTINAVHLRTEFNPIHLQTNEDKQAYLKSLLKIEEQLLKNVESLQKSVHENNDKLEDFQNQDAISGVFLEDVLADERNRIQQMENGLVLPLSLKTWECKEISQEEADAIHQQISQTQNQISILQSKMESQSQCLRNDEVEKQIQFLQLYLNHLMVQLSNKCSSQVSTNVFYVPNSGVSNFVYGDGVTKEDYEKQIRKKRDEGYNSIQCPLSTPYPADNKCVHCDQGTYFDLSTYECLKCQDDLVFNTIKKVCSVVPLNNADSAENYYGPLPPVIQGRQNCQDDTPFFDGQDCISCPLPSYFDFGDHTCKQCEEGKGFDIHTHTCGYAKKNSNPDPNDANYCCGDLPHDDSLPNCPRQTPYFNGISCIDCNLPGFFDTASSKCSLCPSGQGFSIKSGKCIESIYLQPYYQSNLTPENQNYYGNPPQIDSSYEIVKKCAADHPFSVDGVNCKSCASPYYFNFESNNCQLCEEGKKFSIDERKCIILNTQKKNNNMVYITNFNGKVPNYDPNLSTCEKDKPFFNGQECIECKIPHFVDFDDNKCKQCDSGFIFDTFNRQCLKNPSDYYTDLDADNIFYNGDWSNIVQRVEQQKSSNPDMQECSSDKPYYDAKKGQCITCPNEYPLFDIKYNRCITCTGDSEYNAQRRICVLPGSVKATIERMMMNTISWV